MRLISMVRRLFGLCAANEEDCVNSFENIVNILTAEMLKEVYPVAPSDRRKFPECFDFIPKVDLADDEIFYPALLDRMLSDTNYCQSLEAAFQKSPREKERQRAPSFRIGKWLKNAVPGLKFTHAREEVVEALAELTPLQGAVFDLWERFVFDQGERLDFVEAAPDPDHAAEPEWLSIRRELQGALDDLVDADTDVAARILGKAEDLIVACADFQREAASRNEALLLSRREGFLSALDRVGVFADGADLLRWIEAADSLDKLKRLEGAIAGLPYALDDLDAKSGALADAIAAEDKIRADRSRSRAELRAALEEAEAAEMADQAARAKVADLLRDVIPQLDQQAEGVDVSPDVVGMRDHVAAVLSAEVLEPTSSDAGDARVEETRAVVDVAEDAAPLDEGSYDERQSEPDAPSGSQAQSESDDESESPVAVQDEVDRLAIILDETSIEAPDVDPEILETVADDGPAAVWTGRKSFDELLADYLDKGELALAWHLADLAEEAGHQFPVPSLLLKALAAGPSITGPYDQSTQTMGEVLAGAMSGLDRAEEEGPAASLRANSIALAALMRPALMARDTNARELLDNLSLAGPLSAYTGVVKGLAGLRHDLQPSIAELNALAGVEKTRRVPQVVAEMQVWLPGARAAQSMHAPSNTVLHNLVSPQSRFGRLFEAAQNDRLGVVEADLDFLFGLARDKSFAEGLVADEERALSRPRRDAIRGMALEWICRKLREGAELILRWRAAKNEDGGVDDHRKEDLGRYVNGLRKELERVAGEASTDEGLDAAVQRCLGRAVDDMLALVNGQMNAVSISVSDALNLPLLRLPGSCQPQAPDDNAYVLERRAQRVGLLAALSAPERLAPDDFSALRQHLRDHAILPARQLLVRFEREAALSDVELSAMRQELEDARHAASVEAQKSITTLRHEMEPLQSIDLGTSQQIQLWLDRLAAILAALSRKPEDGPVLPAADGQRVPDIPPDFPQLVLLLNQAHTLRDSIRERIMRDQVERLQRLLDLYEADGRADLAEQARQVIQRLGEQDPLTVEDSIVRLQNGQGAALVDEAKDDHFVRFYPGFVSDLEAADTISGQIKAAIVEGGRAGPLDYSRLDESDRKRSGELFENWRQLSNALRPNRSDLGQPLRQFMERLGFTSVAIERETVLSDQLRTMRMRCDELTAQHWFLPPVFGSEARGSYPVFLAHRNIDDAQVARELAKEGRDAPCILLVFGSLTRARRENFVAAMRRAKQTVLLIDEAQVLYLTMNAAWTERLFACAVPFGYVQPYTTSAGNIPGEMFFGREDEIRKIESATTDGCLVYGGRQLGKSALLHHVRKRFHRPQTGRHAYYLKIDEFGGQVQPAEQIWSEIRRVLVADQILSKTAVTVEDIADSIKGWLDHSGERRILLLIDEADMFLASEVRAGFPNLNTLKDVMEDTARRFKVVFAGLHNVRRLARAPNSPLVHLSEPICIGPMNTSVESSLQARRLVTEPMRAAGFDYASPDLVQALLTRVNYYPSLVQVFCKALLEGISNQPRPRGQGPRWVLGKDNLFESSSSGDINAQIKERFQWTLNLDPRYELIAKVLALHRLDAAERDGGAMAPDAIAHEVEGFWPSGYEKLPGEDFRAFLNEMVDLGVLIQLDRPKGFYGLRGAQVAQMLGQREQLEREILLIAEKEPRVDYDPGTYHRRVRSDQSERRSPLSDNALQRLFDTDRPGLRFLAVPSGIWGGDAAQAVADLAEGWKDRHGFLGGALLRGGEEELRRLVERGGGRRVLVIPAGAKVPSRWLSWLAERDQVSRQGAVVPVFVGGHEQIAQLLHQASGIKVQRFRARPWERNMLRAWLAEIGLQALDTAGLRKVLLEVSGGSPVLLARLRPGLEALVSGGRSEDGAEIIRELGAGFRLMPSEIGLPERLVPEFCTAVELLDGGAERPDLIGLLMDEGNAEADKDLRLMERLGLFHRPDSACPDLISCSALGDLVFRSCESPDRGGLS